MTIWERIKRWIGIAPRYLCDNCKYDYPSACYNAARPNVTKCGNYLKK